MRSTFLDKRLSYNFCYSGGFSVFAGVGERTREGNDLYHEMIEGGVIKLGNEASDSKCTLVYGQMNEPPGARARVGLTGLTVAEYFRDFEGQDVLLFVDNIFRFTQANSEVSALFRTYSICCRLSTNSCHRSWWITRKDYDDHEGGRLLQSRLFTSPADDLTDPAPATTFATLRCDDSSLKIHCGDRHLSSS